MLDQEEAKKIFTSDVNIKPELDKQKRKKRLRKIAFQVAIILLIATVSFFLIFTISVIKK